MHVVVKLAKIRRAIRPATFCDAAERRIDVRIARAEPVAERRPQELARGRRRRALHHEVLAVEEIRRVFRIRRHRAESPGTAQTPCSSIPSRCRRDPQRPRRSRRPDGCRPAPDPSSRNRTRRARPWARRRPTDHRRSPPGEPNAARWIFGFGRQPRASRHRAKAAASAWLTYTGHASGSGISSNMPRQCHASSAVPRTAGA